MKKRILSLLLAVLLLSAFPACASQETENPSQNPASDGDSAAGTTDGEPEPEPDKFDYARQKYEEKFTAAAMTRQLEALYEKSYREHVNNVR